jgi:hypothetical protein
VPFERPVTVAVVVVPLAVVAVKPPGDELTLYDVIALPPLFEGAVQLTVAWAFPGVAVAPVGAPGGPVGVTAADAVDAGPVPALLVAVTVKV